jgi:hypothetical protein
VTSQVPSLCMSCAHAEPTVDELGTPNAARCAAYPDRIPFDISLGVDHREPRGDEAGGITYRQAAGQRAADLHAAWLAFRRPPQALPTSGR